MNKRQKLFNRVLVVIVVVIIGFVFLIKEEKNNSYIKLTTSIVSPTPTPFIPTNLTKLDMSNWKQYAGYGFRINFPADWKINNLYAASEIGTLKGFDFVGSQGDVTVEWLSSLPSLGACAGTTLSQNTKAGLVSMCEELLPNNQYGMFLYAYISKNGKFFLIQSSVKSPLEENADQVLGVVSTFGVSQ